MARTVNEIKQQVTALLVSEMAGVGINIGDPLTWSITNIFRLLIFIFSFSSYTLEVLMDRHVEETNEIIRSKKPPSKSWYSNLILAFQYGFPLSNGIDEFDNTGYTEQQIEASKVIKHVAVIKQVNIYGRVKLLFKIAGSSGTDRIQSAQEVVIALSEYLETAAAAGDNWEVVGRNYDRMKQKWRIYYDPLILNAQGGRLDGTDDAPVKKAIHSFFIEGIAKLPFSSSNFGGTYVTVSNIDWIQKVQGVKIPELLECSANYGNTAFVPVQTEYTPNGGWIKIQDDADLQIEYIAHNAI